MRSKTYMILPVFGLLLIAAVALQYGFRGGDSIQVTTVPLESGSIEQTIRVTGRVINDKTVTLTALLDGQVQGMLVQKGEAVEVGRVLAYLDKREADAHLSRAEAIVEREQKTVEQLSRKLDRLSRVSHTGGESRQVVDDVALSLSMAESQLRVAQAGLNIARIHREKVEITAPFDGVITEKSTEVGQWVEAGTKLLTMVADEGREIEARIDAADSGMLSIGQKVTVNCDAYPGVNWGETVHWIAPALTEDETEATNTFAARMSLSADAPSLLLGQQVDVTISVAQRKNTPKLPYSALLDGDDGSYRIAVVKEGSVSFLPVEIGIEDLTHVEILSDIKMGAEVILPSGITLREGDQVTILSGATQ
ncbi:MAG: efflux RND transporter periplasmic adaptor subunit [Candidatus Thiodiazotropha sp. (ex Dulcina madagascariensis)]|nr:efflux RND transporter periplasmic adaptor subunit [Candidatus Thiodiazotropha sp. (ex Dulcina madagascariensis)]